MKLKRCPNLHYYDGDKYDSCPHCADQPAPAPAPKPIFEPVPQPETKKESVPQPEPKPQPKPVPDPVIQQETVPEKEKQQQQSVVETPPSPAPQPVSDSALSPEDEGAWRCKCGAVNNGRFCFECGSPKPVPEKKPEPPRPAAWKCTCGAENTGKFCHQCGSPKPQANTAPDQNAVVTPPEPKPPVPVPAPAPQPAPQPEEDPSLTSMLQEAKYTGTMDDVRKKTSKSDDDDDGVTQVVFDEISDGFALAWLTVTNSSSKGKVFTLTEAKTTIGRADPEHPVDIDLHNDKGISRGAQATIVYDPLNKKFFLQNTGGKTFVYVNKEILLTYNELKAYDIIRIGETNLVFVPLCNEKFSW